MPWDLSMVYLQNGGDLSTCLSYFALDLTPYYISGTTKIPPDITSFISNKGCSQFSSVAQSCPALCDPMDCSMPGLPVHQQLPEFTETHVHWVSDAIQPSHPFLSPSPPTFNHSQHQGLFKWVSSSHQVAKVLEFQLQHQIFQWIFSIDFRTNWISLLSKGLSRVFSKHQFFDIQLSL